VVGNRWLTMGTAESFEDVSAEGSSTLDKTGESVPMPKLSSCTRM
jgi:hypothetical protein